jgi:hypothetical protein
VSCCCLSAALVHRQTFKEHCKGFKIINVPYINSGRRRKSLYLTVPPEILPCSRFGVLYGKDGGSLVFFPQLARFPRLATCRFPCGVVSFLTLPSRCYIAFPRPTHNPGKDPAPRSAPCPFFMSRSRFAILTITGLSGWFGGA